SLCMCGNPLNSSKLEIHPVPQYAAEGDVVLLQVHNLPEDVVAFAWYKSMYKDQVLEIVEYNKVINFTSWGPVHRRRGMVYNNGSLMLQNVTENDAGIYILEVTSKD
ncbi:carcinoembryonic antigen-related cell adhesion molecule 3-like, partial [Sigmodon hispidus]